MRIFAKYSYMKSPEHPPPTVANYCDFREVPPTNFQKCKKTQKNVNFFQIFKGKFFSCEKIEKNLFVKIALKSFKSDFKANNFFCGSIFLFFFYLRFFFFLLGCLTPRFCALGVEDHRENFLWVSKMILG